jgi:hypothetical protein
LNVGHDDELKIEKEDGAKKTPLTRKSSDATFGGDYYSQDSFSLKSKTMIIKKKVLIPGRQKDEFYQQSKG